MALQRGAKGREVTRLEIRLGELGLYDGGFDDSFGPGLEKAVAAFQRQRGLPATGVADDATSQALFADPSPRLAAVKGKPLDFRCLMLTSLFETDQGVPGCFGALAGSFDGQGISFGVLQWNLGQGTLQTLLKRVNAANPEVLKQAFGDGCDKLVGILSGGSKAGLAFASTIQDGKNRVSEPWKSRFKALGAAQACQDAQPESAAGYFDTGRALFAEYGLTSERGMALMFDIAVQNGSIKPPTRAQIFADFAGIPAGATREEREVARMRIIANRRADASNAAADVRSRKLTIAEGVGVVHGNGVDVERHYGITLAPAQL